MNTCPALSKGNLSVSIHLPINLGIIQQKILFKDQTVDRHYIYSVPQTPRTLAELQCGALQVPSAFLFLFFLAMELIAP